MVVVGAGPGGAEAALAAAGAGARTLCLTMSLDTAGYHPANPTLVGGHEDPRGELLAEMRSMGCRLPPLLESDGVAAVNEQGRLVADRRRLGLAYKAAIESADNLEFRQALVTSLETHSGKFLLGSSLDESFSAGAVVIAGGTFFQAEVAEGDARSPGGRRGEIPSVSLSKSLQNKGILFERIGAATAPRLLMPPPGGSFPGDDWPDGLPPDGDQLCELYGFGLEQSGDAERQLSRLRQSTGDPAAWITRPSYAVSHLVLASRQVNLRLESTALPRLFFAGRLVGCCNYLESAATGFLAGLNAAHAAGTAAPTCLIDDKSIVSHLLRLVADSESRPVTIRVPGPGC